MSIKQKFEAGRLIMKEKLLILTNKLTFLIKKYFKLIFTHDSLMIFFTFIIAVSTWRYTSIAEKQMNLMTSQLDIMNSTLEEMKTSGANSEKQTSDIIKQAERIASVSESTSIQSKDVLDATIKNFRLDQRAWIGPIGSNAKSYKVGDKKVILKNDEPLQFYVNIKNSGKTPAKITHSSVAISVKPSDKKLNDEVFEDPPNINSPDEIFFLQPNGEFQLKTNKLKLPGEDWVKAVSNGDFIIYITGLIKYEDVFGESHHTKFCYYLSQDLSTILFYNEFNELN